MDQLYPIEGPTTSSCTSQDFDFLNYWVDQSVEKEIHRGKQLRELKQRPILGKQKYDVINIGDCNFYSEKKLKCRSKSPRKSRKKTRKTSPKRKKCPSSNFMKKDSKSAQRCPLRIAELSVPSKRQCIDTWRNKHHVLPGIMIDRLRQHVLDLRPVVKIPDAIESFKIHKRVERKKKKEIKQRKIKIAIKACDCPKKKIKPTKTQQCRYLCAIFGYKIAKELNKPARIILNSELKMLSYIVSSEIDELINKCKGVKGTNVKNKRVHAEVAEKITIWISNILEESAYRILEDQLKDLEEEVGPVLDLIDDLVDDVVGICEPETEFLEVSSSSETISIQNESQEETTEGETNEEEIREEESTSEMLQFDEDSRIGPQSTTESLENLDDYVKNELDKIIDSFDQDDISVDIDGIAIDDDKFTDTEDQSIAIENQIDKEQTEFVDANDTLEVPLDDTKSHIEVDDLGDSSQADQGTLITDQERDKNIITATNDSANDIVSEDESNKKVKFSDIRMVTIGEINEQSEKTTQHVNTEQFSAPNDHLLSDADESWPDNIALPFLRPSESASKSITSLGKIMEEEERISVSIDNNRKTKDKNDLSNDERDAVIDLSKQKELVEQGLNKLNDKKIKTTNLSQQKLIELLEPADKGKYDTKESLIQKEPPEIEPPADIVEAEIGNVSEENSLFESTKEVIGQIMESIIEKGQAQFEPLPESANNSEQRESKQLTPSSHKAKDGLAHPYEQKDTEHNDKYIIDENGIIYIDGIHSLSTDSTFPLDVPIESAEFELKLPIIIEEQVIVEDKLKENKTEVEKGDTLRTRKDIIKTAEIGTNTSAIIIPRAEKSTSVSSQSLGDITNFTKYIQVKKPDWFSSVRIKPKDNKVDKNTAPTWVSRNNGEPYHISKIQTGKVTNDKNLRLWCKDLENGFENLELWNGWLEKTVQSLKISEMKKARICLDKSREQFVRDWLLLKRNVDDDVLTWTKLSKSTQEKMKAFRKIYQNFQTPTPSPGSKLGKSCICHR